MSIWLVHDVFSQSGHPLGLGVYSFPIWSPDGRKLAFTFSQAGTSNSDLWVLEIETEEFTRIEFDSDVSLVSGLAWQDNYVVWFMDNLPTTRLYQADIRNSQVVLVLNLEEQLWYGYSFNPNHSNELIFAATENWSSSQLADLYSLDTATLSITRLTETQEVEERAPLWSPDGQYLAYGDYGDARLIDREGNVTSTPNVNADVHRYTWSPDSTWFLSVGGYRRPGLYLTSRDSGGRAQISNVPAARVSWSPDGSRIAYVTVGSPGQNELHVVSAEELDLTLPISNIPLRSELNANNLGNRY